MIVLGEYFTPEDESGINLKRIRRIFTMHVPLMGYCSAFGREEAARESVGMVRKCCMAL